METSDTIAEIYRDFAKRHNDLESDDTEHMEYRCSNVKPSLDHKSIIDAYHKSCEKHDKPSIVVRPYNEEQILVVGCGNNVHQALNCHDETGKSHKDFPLEYTIDCDPEIDPSIIGYFGQSNFDSLPDHCFAVIVFEGVVLNDIQTWEEVKRLAKPHAPIMTYCGNTTVYNVDDIDIKKNLIPKAVSYCEDGLWTWKHDDVLDKNIFDDHWRNTFMKKGVVYGQMNA